MSTDSSSKSHAARPCNRNARFAVSLTASFPRIPARSSRRLYIPSVDAAPEEVIDAVREHLPEEVLDRRKVPQRG